MKLIQTTIKIIIAIILLQTLFFKFSASAESVFIFKQMNAEPYGRIISGIIELFIALSLFNKKLEIWGIIMGAGMMLMAILSHVFVLGIEIMDDGGLLFYLALFCFLGFLFLIYSHKNVILNSIYLLLNEIGSKDKKRF